MNSRSSICGVVPVLRKYQLPSCVFLLAAILPLASCGSKPAVLADQPVAVEVRLPHRIQQRVSIAASGAVEANISALTAFQVSGRVLRVFVEEGQHVNRGQVLAELDPADYRHALAAAEGQADAARAAERKGQNGLRPEELEQARIEFERTQDEYQRMKFLYDRKSLDANSFHKFEAAYLVASQNYAMARQGARGEDRSAASAQSRTAAAQMEDAKTRLSYCRLVAPIAGYIGMRHINVGDTVAAGNPVFSVLDLDPVQIRVGIPESEVGAIHTGVRAIIKLPALGNQTFEGKLKAVGVAADPVSRTYTAKITVANPSHLLRDGMVSQTRIYGTTETTVITIPGNAIVRDARGVATVYVYYPDKQRVFARRVEVGDFVGNEVGITSGLDVTDRVVVAGQQSVREGASVRLPQGVQ